MGHDDGRIIIAAGPLDDGDRHLIPLVEFLVERGHRPIVNQHDHGFFYLAGKRRCWLSRRITRETWQAVAERFVLPDNILLSPGLIEDKANEVLIVGWDRVILEDGLHSVEVWEERGCPEIAAEPEPEDTGTIRDEVNDVRIVGTDELFDGVQSVCVELWEEALPSGWAAAAEGQRDEPS